MGTTDRILGKCERSRENEGGKATERGRRRAPPIFGAVFGVLALVLVVTFVASPPTGHAAFPGVSGKIAFHSDRDGNWEIYVMNADGSGLARLTNNSVVDLNPAWSPDGTKIVFDRSRDGIYVMNADGTGQARLTNSFDTTPAWSPDGTKIVFSSYRDGEPNSEIYVMNADGTGQTRRTNNSVIDNDPAWSPDGMKIAFVRAVFGGQSQIYLMNADGSGQAQLSPSDGRLVNGPNWSPDGTKIAYGGGFGFGATADIYVINADGSGQTNLTPSTPGSETVPAWSPDSTKIAFVSDRDGINAHIYVMNADGSGQTSLTNNPANNDSPDWQPLPVAFAAFAAFDVEVEIELGSLANEDEFEVKGTFTLGADSNGIEILTEIVSLELTGGAGSFSTTIPAGSFEFKPAKPPKKGKPGKPAHFKFEGVIDGVFLEVKITPLGNGSFELKAEGQGADLSGIANQVTVDLAVGDDRGSTTAGAEFE